MGRKKFCYWSVADGQHARMMQTCVRSARAARVREDFHVWSDRAIAGAIAHDAGQFDKHLYHFKFDFLQKQAARLNYDYFVWLDADNFFVRHPGDVLSVLGGDAIHACLESNMCALDNLRPDWWGCPLPALVKFMRVNGVRHDVIYNTNAGFWIVHHDVIKEFCEEAEDFWYFCYKQGHEFTEEPLLAFVAQKHCSNSRVHTIPATDFLWASDWKGRYAGRLPDGRDWYYEDYMSAEQLVVNPAIVHAMRSKEAMVKANQAKPRRLGKGLST